MDTWIQLYAWEYTTTYIVHNRCIQLVYMNGNILDYNPHRRSMLDIHQMCMYVTDIDQYL